VQPTYLDDAPEIESVDSIISAAPVAEEEFLDSVVPVLDQQVEFVEPVVEEIPAIVEAHVVAESVSHDGPLLSEEELSELEAAPFVPLILDGPETIRNTVVMPEQQAAAVSAPEPELILPKPEFIDAPMVVEEYDEEIAEIFIEEATEVLDAIREFYPKWRENFDDNASLTEFRRAFHTLKGSGRMAKAIELGELSWSVENMLNRIIDGTIVPGDELCLIIERVVEKIPSMIEAFSQRKVDPHPALSQRLSAAAFAVASGLPMTSLDAPADAVEGAIEGTAQSLSEMPAMESVVSVEDVVAVAEPEDMDEDFDAVLWEIFASEAETHLEVADEWLAYARERSPIAVETTDPLQRALHTLKGSAHMAEVTPIAELATPFEKLVKELRAYQIKVGDDFINLFAEVVAEIRYGLELIENHKRVVLPHCADLLSRTEALRMALTGGGEVEATSKAEAPVLATVDPTRFNNFLINDMDALMDVAPSLSRWSEQQDSSGLERIVFELTEMAAGAEAAGLPPIAALARSIVPGYAHATSSAQAFAAWEPLALEAHNEIIDFMDRLAASEDLVNNTLLEEKIAAYCATQFSEEMAVEEVVATEVFATEMLESETLATENFATTTFTTGNSAVEDAAMLAELDSELLDIFLEEADELLEELEGIIHQWSEDTYTSMADDLRRTLHTFKGGARMSGLMLLGTLAHDLETQLEYFSGEADAAFINMLHDCQDRLFRGVAMVKAWRAGDASLLNFSSLLPEGFTPEAFAQEELLVEAAAPVYEPELPVGVYELPVDVTTFATEEPTEEIFAAMPEEVLVAAPEYEMEEVVFPVDLAPVEYAVADALTESTTPSAVNGILEYSDDIDSELLDIFLEEADELVEELEQLIADWQANADDNSFADGLRRNLHTLKGGARMSGLMGLGLLAHDLETQLEQFVGPADQELFTQILQYQDAILAGVTQGRAIAAGQSPQPMSVAMPGVAAVAAQEFAPEAEAIVFESIAPETFASEVPVFETVGFETTEIEFETAAPETIEYAAVEYETVEVATIEAPAAEVVAVDSEAANAMADLGIADDADPEMFSLFLEEASELLDDLDAQIQGWHEAPDDSSFCDAMKRNLHTFKGGARMTGIMGLGDLAHDLETQLEFFTGVADEALFSLMHSYHDKMVAGVNLVQRIVAGESMGATPQAVAPAAVQLETTFVAVNTSDVNAAEVNITDNAAVSRPAPSATIIPFRGGKLPRGLEEAIAGKKSTHAAAEAKAAQAQQEMIKVSADLLENLVNLAGETSISRSRVEQQMIDIERTAEEMESTILRLQDQLRRLESETDAQIQSRQAEIQERSDDFDPLEMDRYSTVQQLTSSLSESASDLLDIRSSLNNKLRDTETLVGATGAYQYRFARRFDAFTHGAFFAVGAALATHYSSGGWRAEKRYSHLIWKTFRVSWIEPCWNAWLRLWSTCCAMRVTTVLKRRKNVWRQENPNRVAWC
jgi:chemosensory pili system protein ChpA (sensor histidine kinase/response regulator)